MKIVEVESPMAFKMMTYGTSDIITYKVQIGTTQIGIIVFDDIGMEWKFYPSIDLSGVFNVEEVLKRFGEFLSKNQNH